MSAPLAFWSTPTGDVLGALGTSATGLSAGEARTRLAARRPHGPRRMPGWLRSLIRQFASPIILILITATIVSMALGDPLDGSIILAIVTLSGLLGFFQEARAGNAVAELLASVQVTADVLRDGAPASVPVAELVPGDVVLLSAGSVVPGDCRLLDGDELQVDESALTGEAFPAEKDPDAEVHLDAPLAQRANSVFFGSHVVSGEAHAVIATVAADTQYGAITHDLREHTSTAFEKGITRFGMLLVWLMVVLSLFIFAVNAIAGRGIIAAMLFAVALAVGITPQLLPAIVSLSLSSGARRLAASKVIVKRLDAIEDLGTITVLATDKTGTLTEGAARLDKAIDPAGAESERTLRLASLNAGLQTGFANPLDAAVLARSPLPVGSVALDEVPYDFKRKRLSVVTAVDGVPTLITKGALASVLQVCTAAPAGVERLFESLSDDGFRVLGIASRPLAAGEVVDRSAEVGMTLEGLLCFLDPPKASAADALRDLESLGISMRLITGDNARVAVAVAKAVGLDTAKVLTGSEIDRLGAAGLAQAARDTYVFAEVEPDHKKRIVQALRTLGESVAFLGDGINDTPALHVADVGISVDTGVDVAKQEAAVVLLDKGLDVVADGVRLGRQTFANTLKYIRMSTSSNFGNMLSMAIASMFLPFLPLLPRQILLLNFLGDLPSTTLAADYVDPERLAQPVKWDLKEIRRFMFVFGPVSTCFDLLTFGVLIWGVHADEMLFQTSWFVVSTLTEVSALFSLRTTRPIWRSRPALALAIAAILVGAIAVAMPYVPFIAEPMGLIPLDGPVLAALAVIALAYIAANEIAKAFFFRRQRRAQRSG